jgi:hypothetical protein
MELNCKAIALSKQKIHFVFNPDFNPSPEQFGRHGGRDEVPRDEV